jgi:predicted DsbA family dithiol-disulfide isomerase
VLTVEVWSDIVCPWCYIGLHRFESALARFAHRDEVAVRHRSFELDRNAPAVSHATVVEHLAEKYGISHEQAARFEQQAADAAAAESLPFRSDRIRANTFDAHRLLHLAAQGGDETALLGALFAAHFAEGRVLSDHETLIAVAAEAGIDAEQARRALQSGAYGAEVRAEARDAAALGIHSVPFFVLDRRYALPGAQPAGAILDVLDRAWTARHSLRLFGSSARRNEQ